jgi:hypothetical protein
MYVRTKPIAGNAPSIRPTTIASDVDDSKIATYKTAAVARKLVHQIT